MKFKSQICTSREQSERLLALGLKKETADMCSVIDHVSDGGKWEEVDTIFSFTPDDWNFRESVTPRWSLHRLLSLLPQSVKIGKNYYALAIMQNEFVRLIDDIGDIYIYFDRDGIYESLLLCIEWLIKEGYFNKKYLEE